MVYDNKTNINSTENISKNYISADDITEIIDHLQSIRLSLDRIETRLQHDRAVGNPPDQAKSSVKALR